MKRKKKRRKKPTMRSRLLLEGRRDNGADPTRFHFGKSWMPQCEFRKVPSSLDNPGLAALLSLLTGELVG